MRSQHGKRNQGLDPPEAGSQGEQAQAFADFLGSFSGTFNFEAENAAAAFHLLDGQRPLRVPFEKRIIHRSYLGMLGEEFRYAKSALVLPLDPYGQGLDPPQQ